MAQDSEFRVPGPSRSRGAERLELFPTLSMEVPEKTIYDYTDLKDLYGQVDIHPFIPYMDKKVERIYIDKIKWSDKVILNLNRLAKDAGGHIIEERAFSWDRIAKILSSENKKSDVNLDRRLSYVFDHHYFLVRSGFTFGLRTVYEGTIHLYQTTTRPIHLYFQPRNGRYAFKMGKRMLPVVDNRKYCHTILKSDTAYRVTPGTNYIVIVSQKAYFSLHVLPENMRIPFRTVDPVEQFRADQRERRRAFQYAIPPPTPNLLERPEEPVFQVPQQPCNFPPPNLHHQPQQPEEEPPPAYEELYPVDPELHQEPEPQQLELHQEPQQPEPHPLQPEPELHQEPEPQQLELHQEPEPQQPRVWIFQYPLESHVNIVTPQLVKWYHSLKRTIGPIYLLECPPMKRFGAIQTEPVDLSTRVQAASTSRPAAQLNDTGEGSASEDRPAAQPSGEPAAQPSGEPAAQPSGEPAAQPSGEPAAQPSGGPAAQLKELSGTRGVKRRSSTERTKKKKKKRTPSEEKLEKLIFPEEELEELDQMILKEHPDTAQVFEDLCKITCNIDC